MVKYNYEGDFLLIKYDVNIDPDNAIALLPLKKEKVSELIFLTKTFLKMF